MEDLDICPKCGMGKRIEYELFKTDKGERKKDFEDYEKEYLNRLENNKAMQKQLDQIKDTETYKELEAYVVEFSGA